MPVDTVPTTQDVQGPDGKTYKFSKSITPARVDKYFQKQGWIKKDGKWFTQTGEEAKKGLATDVGTKAITKDPTPSLSEKNIEKGAATLPSVMGGVGGYLTGGKGPTAAIGAGLGGAIGEDLRQMIMRPILLGRGQQDLTAMQSLQRMGIEASKQAALQYGGEKTGDFFFKMLNKIPHAVIKKGIPLLPGDLATGGKVNRYVEDLLGNLAPSAKVIADFRQNQSGIIKDKLETLVNGFAKFDGNSEEMGQLLQKVMQKGRKLEADYLETLRATLPKGHQTDADLKKAFPKETRAFFDHYMNQLSDDIVRTRKPELIAGWLKTTHAGLMDTRIVHDVVNELDSKTLGKVKNRIIRDSIEETFAGRIDPVAKGSVESNFAGKTFKDSLDKMGETKAKAILGEKDYKKVEDFVKLVGNVRGNVGGGPGSFFNLVFLVPFRSGFSPAGMTKVAMAGIFANRIAHIITNDEGGRVTAGYLRAVAQQTPRAMNAFREEIKTMSEQADQEYVQEEKEAEQEYNKEKINK